MIYIQQIGQMRQIRYLLTAILSLLLGGAAICSANEIFHTLAWTTPNNKSVFSIVSDKDGYLWMGTNEGVVRYDGYRSKHYRYNSEDSLSLSNDVVNVMLVDGRHILMGTDSGLSIYDCDSDKFFSSKRLEGKHIKALCKIGENYLAGTTTGLFVWDGENFGKVAALPSDHISYIATDRGRIFAGAYGHIYELDRDKPLIVKKIHKLPGLSSSTLVLAICGTERADRLMVGAENGMWIYDCNRGRMTERLIRDIPVKAFLEQEGRLWIGSDKGLFIREGNGVIREYYHKVGDQSSLPNDVVWCISRDGSGNIILGTDHGAAIVETDPDFQFTGVNSLTSSDAGLDIGVMLNDGRGNLWLGGRNGLIRCGKKSSERYFSDSGPMDKRLSHNKIRSLYYDYGKLWAATDGGLNIYDYSSGSWHFCNIFEPSGNFSSNWMYSIAADDSGRLWIGTYDGGIFVIDHRKAAAKEAVCDFHRSSLSSPSLSGNIIRSLVYLNGKIYADCGNNIDIIDTETLNISHIALPSEEYITGIKSIDGKIVAGTNKCLYQLTEGKLQAVIKENIFVDAFLMRDGNFYLCSGNRLYRVQDGKLRMEATSELPLMQIVQYNGQLHFGTIDGLLTETERTGSLKDLGQIRITGFKVNEEYAERSLWCASDGTYEVDLPHSSNTFAVEFSDFNFSQAKHKFCYRLKGFDEKWREAESGRVNFLNLPAGHYIFEVAHSTAGNEPLGNICQMSILIRPIWYATTLAYIIYILLAIILIAWIVYIVRMRQQLEIEKIEREKAIEAADGKTRFLNNITNEFKGELGTVLNFVDRMSRTESDALKSVSVREALVSAEKMHLLIEKMSEYNSDNQSSLFIPSPVVIEDFAEEVWDEFREGFEQKQLNHRFVSDRIGYVFFADKLLLATAIRNLLSNALKFTPSGGSVLMSVKVCDENKDMVTARIRIEDTGCGIAQDEMPMIFNRFYTAPSGHSVNPDGKGDGLFKAKNIIDLHKGRLTVSSKLGQGSCFSIELSTMKADSFILKETGQEEIRLHELSNIWRHNRKPIILMVEENKDIRDITVASLGNDYSFLLTEDEEEALKLLKTEKIDLVITGLPSGGTKLCRSIRENLTTTFLPVIFIGAGQEAKGYSIDCRLNKPLSLSDLNNNIIKLLIKHEQYLDKIHQQKMLSPQIEDVQSEDSRFLKEIGEIIARHIDDPEFSAAQLCEESHWSAKQVYRRIKALTGMTVIEFIRDARLSRAELYLLQNHLTINEIMYKVGFTTASYFAKCFKDRYGVTPSEYLTRHSDSRSGRG